MNSSHPALWRKETRLGAWRVTGACAQALGLEARERLLLQASVYRLYQLRVDLAQLLPELEVGCCTLASHRTR